MPKTATRRAAGDLARLRAELRGGPHAPHYYVALLGLRATGTEALVARVHQGLPYTAFDRFRKNVQLSIQQLAELVQIPIRTLSRRKARKRLLPDESDRLVRASRVFAEALELFEGDLAGAKRWLATPQQALAGRTPLALAQSEVGAREVEQLIGRLTHGIPS